MVGVELDKDSWVVALAIDYGDVDTDYAGGSIDRQELGGNVGGVVDFGNALYAFSGARIAKLNEDVERLTEIFERDLDTEEHELVAIRPGYGDRDGRYYAIEVGVGYFQPLPSQWYLGTSASISYSREELDSYVEHFSDGSITFRLDDDEWESVLSRIELELARAKRWDSMVLIPSISAAYLHEFTNDSRLIQRTSSPQLTGDLGFASFSIRTNEPDRDYFNVGAGVEVHPTGGRWSISAEYGALLGQSFLDRHTVAAALRRW